MSKPFLSEAESEMVELLSMLIEHEAIEHPTPDCPPPQMLEHLLEARGLSKAQLARDAALPRSVITNVLAGRRAISKAIAIKLARYFRLPLHLFIEAN